MFQFPDSARDQAVASIRRYFKEELDHEIGDLKAGMVLDYFLKELAPTVYNAAIGDAQAFLRERIADLDGAHSAKEFAFWPAASVRKPAR